LSPYHPELNPIEYAWGKVKRGVAEAAAYNIQSICGEVLPTAFSSVTTDIINKFFNHVKNCEENYFIVTEEKAKLLSEMSETAEDNINDNSDDSEYSNNSSVASDLEDFFDE